MDKKYLFALIPVSIGALLILAGMGAFFGIFFGDAYPKMHAQHNYKQATCTVVAYEPVKQSGHHYIATLSANINDKIVHLNKRANYKWASITDAVEWQASYDVGAAYACFYNGKSSAVIALTSFNAKIINLTIIACGVGVALVGLGLIVSFGCAPVVIIQLENREHDDFTRF